jgi:hypothetical protein
LLDKILLWHFIRHFFCLSCLSAFDEAFFK